MYNYITFYPYKERHIGKGHSVYFLVKETRVCMDSYQLSDHVRILKQKEYLVLSLLGPRFFKRSSETHSAPSTVVHSGHSEHGVKSNRQVLS